MKYEIEIQYSDSVKESKDKKEIITLNTQDIEKSMQEYQRNREPLEWKILKALPQN